MIKTDNKTGFSEVLPEDNEMSVSDIDFMLGTKFCAFDIAGADLVLFKACYSENLPKPVALENSGPAKQANSAASMLPMELPKLNSKRYTQ